MYAWFAQERTIERFVPLAFVFGLVGLGLLPRVQQSGVLWQSFLVAAGVLLLWQLWLFLRDGSRDAPRFVVVVRAQHYVQAMVQFSVFVYWGWHWQPVYEHLPLLLGQVLFAYGFDMLLTWSRGRPYLLGFGPFPIIFSINLFLWFRDDWFYLQFLMIALGFMGKEYVRWLREGRSVHIFNPSAFALGLFSLVLIATGTTHLTWGQEIASTLTLVPNIYTFLFLAGLVVMYFFAITLIAGMAAITLFALSAMYSTAAGVPYFIDSDIPAAVFLGLHLLVTDPSTSPRAPMGKALFGVLYGIGVFALYSMLEAFGAPTFYDKLLCVPLLNLSVIAIDRMVSRASARPVRRTNIAHMGCWIGVFALMTAMGRTDGRHPGDSVPFWQQACAAAMADSAANAAAPLPQACQRLLALQANYCSDNSAWACNELGLHYRRGEMMAADSALARGYFGRACEARFTASCLNLLDDAALLAAQPGELDLRLLLREGGRNLLDMERAALYSRACEHGWAFACEEEWERVRDRAREGVRR